MTWIRTKGRADYRGPVIHFKTPTTERIVGHPLWLCIGFWIEWKLGILTHDWHGEEIKEFHIHRKRPDLTDL